MPETLTVAAARDAIIATLERDAAAHAAGRFADIGRDYDAIDAAMPRTGAGVEHALHVALAFWDGWIDARNHDWRFYEPIAPSDWPRLARSVIDDLSAEREIADPMVLARFTAPPRPSLWARLKARFSGA